MRSKNDGFTLTSVLVSVVIVGVLAAIATPAYYKNLAKSQSSEAISMMDSEKTNVIANLTQFQKCSRDEKPYTVTGKYGSLVIDGSTQREALSNNGVLLKTGCNLTYTFASSGVIRQLAGKKLVTDVFNNGVLSKSSTSNMPTEYIPRSLTTLTEDAKPKAVATPTTEIIVAKDTTEINEPLVEEGNQEPVITVDNNLIGAGFFALAQYNVFNHVLETTAVPATINVDGKLIEFSSLRLRVGPFNQDTYSYSDMFYGIQMSFKNPADQTYMNQFSKVLITITAQNGKSISGYLNKPADNLWFVEGEEHTLMSQYKNINSRPDLWQQSRTMFPANGVMTNRGYDLQKGSFTLKFEK